MQKLGTSFQARRQILLRRQWMYFLQAVGNVGFKSKRGRHTTRSAVLLDMPGGGRLMDTPGFNYPNLKAVTSKSLKNYFPEIVEMTAEATCRFSNCAHVHEPDCIVQRGWERYEYYVRCAPQASASSLLLKSYACDGVRSASTRQGGILEVL
jgi:ribosome biogenesis GTPase / thiamine phosphate phosphatase